LDTDIIFQKQDRIGYGKQDAINWDWFAWCGSLLWLNYYCWMMGASLNHCKKMGTEPGKRFLKQPAAKLEPAT